MEEGLHQRDNKGHGVATSRSLMDVTKTDLRKFTKGMKMSDDGLVACPTLLYNKYSRIVPQG